VRDGAGIKNMADIDRGGVHVGVIEGTATSPGSRQRRGSNQISGGAGSSQGQRHWPQGENEVHLLIILTPASWPIRRDAPVVRSQSLRRTKCLR
jgi:hypothetical protein